MSLYARLIAPARTPQSEPIPGSPMTPNSAGGFAFAVDDWMRLDRFLILGNEGGTYYASERKLTEENAACVLRCLAADGARAIDRVAEVSRAGRAPKNDAAIFALALGFARGDLAAKRRAAEALPVVCRTGYHLFQFAASVNALRGWGRVVRRAVGAWYAAKDARDLAYQATKYQSRGGWSHRDLLRLAHPKAAGLVQDVLHWIVKGWPGVGDEPHPQAELRPIWAAERAKRAESSREIARLIREFRLVRECIPTKWLNEPAVWEALLDDMPLAAMTRNLATMTRVGLLAPLSHGTRQACAMLGDAARLKRARLHPVALLAALLTYRAGRGERGRHAWTPVPEIVEALDAAFHQSFDAVEPTGKRWLLALDVSGSMGSGVVAGVPGLTPRVASAALAMVTAATEPSHHLVAFTSGGWSSPRAGRGQWEAQGYTNGLMPLALGSRRRLDDVCGVIESLPMGGTDCALPMLYAAANRIPVDAFVVLTDNETWAGAVHPCQALREYRDRMGIAAKLIVVGMTATQFSIADPEDAGMMDVVGFDTATPAVMADFVRS